MNNMEVHKTTLLKVLKTNRDKHRSVFLKAQENYRKFVIKELDQMLKEARDGGAIKRRVNMVAPMDYTKEYDKLIGLLEMSGDEVVPLTLAEYQQYVQDEWGWSQRANTTNNTYSGLQTLSPMFCAEDASLPSSY